MISDRELRAKAYELSAGVCRPAEADRLIEDLARAGRVGPPQGPQLDDPPPARAGAGRRSGSPSAAPTRTPPRSARRPSSRHAARSAPRFTDR